MYAILLSAINGLLGFIFRTVIIKFILFFGLFFIVHEFVSVLATWLPTGTNLPQLFSALPDTVWYFLNLANVPFGLSLVISAMTTRFIIRRIPVIG